MLLAFVEILFGKSGLIVSYFQLYKRTEWQKKR